MKKPMKAQTKHQIEIRLNNCATNDPCTFCGTRCDPTCGWGHSGMALTNSSVTGAPRTKGLCAHTGLSLRVKRKSGV